MHASLPSICHNLIILSDIQGVIQVKSHIIIITTALQFQQENENCNNSLKTIGLNVERKISKHRVGGQDSGVGTVSIFTQEKINRTELIAPRMRDT